MSTGVPKVLVDANVLYSRTLRDWMVLLATSSGGSAFHLCWTEDIMTEVLFHLRKSRPYSSDPQIGGIRRRFEAALGEHSKIEGYEIDSNLQYEDPHDAHVHAAAVHGRVNYVISNDKGFGQFASNCDAALEDEHYTADDFLILVDDNFPVLVREVVCRQIDYYHGRDKQYNLVSMLRKAGAGRFADRIGRHLHTPVIAAHLSALPQKEMWVGVDICHTYGKYLDLAPFENVPTP